MKIDKQTKEGALYDAKHHLDEGCVIDFFPQENQGLFDEEHPFIVEINTPKGDTVEVYSFETEQEGQAFIDEALNN